MCGGLRSRTAFCFRWTGIQDRVLSLIKLGYVVQVLVSKELPRYWSLAHFTHRCIVIESVLQASMATTTQPCRSFYFFIYLQSLGRSHDDSKSKQKYNAWCEIDLQHLSIQCISTVVVLITKSIINLLFF